ncbi:acid protease [Hypoxylon sp. NC1633]|nr:acid protease [Hypoxylon sp. NC1633]
MHLIANIFFHSLLSLTHTPHTYHFVVVCIIHLGSNFIDSMSLKLLGLVGLAVFSLVAPVSPRSIPFTGKRFPVLEDIDQSLSVPGFQFRRAKPFALSPVERKVQNHLGIRRLPSRGPTKPSRSAAALLGQIQRDNGAGSGYENVTSVSHYAVEYAVQAVFNGIPVSLVVDSGSADTWIRASNFACKGSLNETVSEQLCALGPSFPGNFTGRPIPDQHFSIKYGDGEGVQGRLGHMDVEFAGVTVLHQEVALASQGTWRGNNVTSGIFGLAYPSLTSAYWGNDLDSNNQYNSVPYSPLFTSMVIDGLIEPYWAIAMARNSSLGSISVGGMPPVDLTKSAYDSTPILIADIIHRDDTAWQPSFYTVVPKGFHFGHAITNGEYPFILDTATSLIYLPPNLAEVVNSQFNPPATYIWYYGSYFTSCDAIPPSFGVQIEQTIFWVNPKDLLNKEERDPETGLCQTGISNGGSGPYILGATFLTNVVVSMNIGSGLVEFWSHEFY